MQQIASKRIKLMDGSMCGTLKDYGYDANVTPPHWTFEANLNVELMTKVYKTFADMNIDYLTTNTYHFGSTLDENLGISEQNRLKFDEYFMSSCKTLEHVTKEHNESGEHMCRVLGSIGTYAVKFHDMSEYNGQHIDDKNAYENCVQYFHTILNMFMKHTNIRTFIFETIPAELEARAAVEALSHFPDTSAVISFTLKADGCLRHGESLRPIAGYLEGNKQIVGVGINCTDPSNVLAGLMLIKHLEFDDVFVYPNRNDTFFENPSCNTFVSEEMVKSWINNKATVFGGCCGVSTENLQQLKQYVENLSK